MKMAPPRTVGRCPSRPPSAWPVIELMTPFTLKNIAVSAGRAGQCCALAAWPFDTHQGADSRRMCEYMHLSFVKELRRNKQTPLISILVLKTVTTRRQSQLVIHPPASCPLCTFTIRCRSEMAHSYFEAASKKLSVVIRAKHVVTGEHSHMHWRDPSPHEPHEELTLPDRVVEGPVKKAEECAAIHELGAMFHQ
jgi:hypothetical protein